MRQPGGERAVSWKASLHQSSSELESQGVTQATQTRTVSGSGTVWPQC
jgi:hypothetical protein